MFGPWSSRKAHLIYLSPCCKTEKTIAEDILLSGLFFLCFRGHCYKQQHKKSALTAVPCWKKRHFPCNTAGILVELRARRAPAVSNKGMFMLSIKGWAVIKTHFFFILMNANWHICYGGLAVQTLQLAWLINYRPAGGAVEMEAAAEMGVEVMKGVGAGGREWEMKELGGKGREWGGVRKWSETFVLQIIFLLFFFFLIRLEECCSFNSVLWGSFSFILA